MAVYQQGLLALYNIRQNGQQQYVNVSHGSQALIGNFRETMARTIRGVDYKKFTSRHCDLRD
jgi:hypothetical protein